MKIISLTFFFLSLLCQVSAQNTGKITGNVSKTAHPEGVAISLARAKDSATVKLSVTDKQGQFVFENIANGKYLVVASAVGYQKLFSKIIDLTTQHPVVELPVFELIPVSKDLAAVTVVSKKQLVEQRIDRMIVNVDASITNAGTSALEVLEKSPGVSVDADGKISLKGKEGVLVMVDGRPTQLSAADLANLLRNMSSNLLDQIEIMTNPPAGYDAAGTSGVINIKTKKLITAGMNGSANIAYSQGRYPKTNEGLNLNYREGKINLFTNLSHNYQQRFSTLSSNRNILNTSTNSLDKILNQAANRMSAGNAYSAKAGLDFFASKRTTFGAVFNLNSRWNSADNPNTTAILNAAKNLESVTRAAVNTEGVWKSFSGNINFRTILDKKGKEITADVDVVTHGSDNDLFMVNSYTDATGSPFKKADTIKGLLPQDINIYSARVDYVHPLKNNGRFEAGIKSSIVRTDNNAGYDSIQYGAIIHDFTRSNHFVYEENINAAYANLSAELVRKFTGQFGLRVENTHANGIQKSTGEKFDRHYSQLFPTAFLQYKANDNHTIGATYGRRVLRPSYQSLNPFIRFIDRYTYAQGNPALKPAVSTNIELSHTWKNQVITTLNYTHIKDIIHEVIQQKGQEIYNMPANVSLLDQFGISVSANTTINKWWRSNINVNLYNDNYRGTVNGSSIDRTATSFVLNGTEQFKITKTFNAEINGMYKSGWLEGVMRVKPVGAVGAGLSLQVLKNQGNIRFAARDIFYTQKIRSVTQYGNVDFELSQVSETQVVTISFSYSFSKGKKIAPVKRTAGSANEEQNRIGQ